MPRRAPPHAWRPGESGNPKGRRPGTGKVAALRAQIAEHVPSIVSTLVERAKAGDVQAARLLIERAIPAVRPVELPATVAVPEGESLTNIGRAILRAVTAGELGPRDGSALLAALAGLARVVELDEFELRLRALEEQTQPGGVPT